MSIKKISDEQHTFDKKHGWTVNTERTNEVVEAINEDLIGLVGELGEFSNLIKKINFSKKNNSKTDFESTFKETKSLLAEELIDSLIYLMRISNHLDLDIEKEYEKKLEYNKERYKQYE